LETIDNKDKQNMREELGDLLLQVLFHSRIAEENGDFDVNDVITDISRKMIMRHTHVFGEDKADTAEEVIDKWEATKKKEKGVTAHTDVLRSIPKNLPALMRSYKVQQKAARVGFDWDNVEDAFEKVHEEIKELNDVYRSKNVERITDEMGDVFFALVNVCRFLNIQPEFALIRTINKFIERFAYIERESTKKGKKLETMELYEMDELWNKAKSSLSENK